MIGEVIKEYLVSLGVQIDKPGFNQMQTTLNQTDKAVSSSAAGWAKDFIKAGALISTTLASVSASVAGIMTSAAKQDLAMEKYARSMLVSKDAAAEMKTALDALGESIQDIQLTPELLGRYRSLVADGRNMKVGGDYEGTMRELRDIIFEFTRLKQEANYALQWVGYYLAKHLSGPLRDAKAQFKSFNDSLIKNMPVWTEKAARALVYVINIGKHFLQLLKSIGKAAYDMWDSLPQGVKIATAALAGFFMFLRASPVGKLVALFSALLLLVDDYFGHMEGKQAAMGETWDKLNGYMDRGREKLSDFGNEFNAWLDVVARSETLNEFLDILQELETSFADLDSGVVTFVSEAFRDLRESLKNHEIAEKYAAGLATVKEILWSILKALGRGITLLGQWLEEMGKSEALRDLIDAVTQLLGALLELSDAIMVLVLTAFSAFFGEMDKAPKAYVFRDALKTVVGIISDMIRSLSMVIEVMARLFKMMADNRLFKEFWQGMAQAVKGFSDIVFGAIGMVGKLSRALLALVRGEYKHAAKLAGEALFGKAEASSKRLGVEDGRPYGILSIEGESEGDPGIISPGEGDRGGKSYGLYQFASAWGNERKFAEWATQNYPEIGNALLNSNDFDATWRELAMTKREEFSKAQRDYAELIYFNPAVKELQSRGFDITKRSIALQEVLWSNAIQHKDFAPDAFTDLENLGLGYDINAMSDEEIIKALYKNKIADLSWSEGSPDLRPGLFDRWSAESERALELLRQEREQEKIIPQKTDSGNNDRPALQRPPENMRDPSWWDKLKEEWLWSDDDQKKSSMSFRKPSSYFASAMANADPMLLTGLQRGGQPAYAQTNNGNVTYVTYQVDVGGVEVKNTNASPDEIGMAVGERTASSINERATYVLQNRVLSGVQT